MAPLILQGDDFRWSLRRSSTAIAEWMLDHGVPLDLLFAVHDLDSKAQSKGGATPLHVSAAANNEKMCEMLLKRGAAVNARAAVRIFAV